MKILVTYGSKYGSTRGIAERVAERLRAGGHDVTTTDVRQAGDLSDYGGGPVSEAWADEIASAWA